MDFALKFIFVITSLTALGSFYLGLKVDEQLQKDRPKIVLVRQTFWSKFKRAKIYKVVKCV